MLTFIGACIVIAIMVAFGGFFLQLLIGLFTLILAGIAWLIDEIKKP